MIWHSGVAKWNALQKLYAKIFQNQPSETFPRSPSHPKSQHIHHQCNQVAIARCVAWPRGACAAWRCATSAAAANSVSSDVAAGPGGGLDDRATAWQQWLSGCLCSTPSHPHPTHLPKMNEFSSPWNWGVSYMFFYDHFKKGKFFMKSSIMFRGMCISFRKSGLVFFWGWKTTTKLNRRRRCFLPKKGPKINTTKGCFHKACWM